MTNPELREETRAASPYPGLRPFHDGEAEIFFGREEQTDQLLDKLQHSHFIAVVGQSGCGKSSLVRAGVIASLEAGFLSNAGATWRIAAMRPGEQPLARLVDALFSPSALGSEPVPDPSEVAIAQAMLRRGPLGLIEIVREAALPATDNLLILVDQFEEIFRFREEGKADDADAFIALLLAAASQRDVPIYVVITMRSDFLGDCALFTGLPEAINDGQYLTPRLTREQIQAAIVGPARVFGGDIEPALVNRLLNEIGPDPDQLPLLQHALMRMWAHVSDCGEPHAASGHRGQPHPSALVRMSDYEAVGAFDKALAAHADQVLASLTPRQQEIVRVMLCRLTARGSGKRDIRHPARVDDIAAAAGASIEEVIDVAEELRQDKRSFLTPPPPLPITAATVLDIGHESLIRHWDQLFTWVEAEADSAEKFRRLAQNAELFDAKARGLLTPEEVSVAVEWRQTCRPNAAWAGRYHAGFERAESFLQESVDARDAARREARKRRTRRRLGRAAAIVGSGVVVMGIFFVLHKIDDSNNDRVARLRSDSLAKEESALAHKLVIVNAELQKNKDSLTREKRELQTQRTKVDSLNKVLLSNSTAELAAVRLEANPDSALALAVAAMRIENTPAARGALQRAMLASRLPQQEVLMGESPWAGTSSPDGEYAVIPDSNARLHMWQIASGREAAGPSQIDSSMYIGAFFSARAPMLGALTSTGTVRLWNTTSWRPLPAVDSLIQTPFPALSDDGKYLVGSRADKKLILWETANGRQVGQVGNAEQAQYVAFSPDGRSILTVSHKRASLWSTTSPTAKPTIYGDSAHPVETAQFSPDGAYIVTTAERSVARVYQTDKPEEAQDLESSESITAAEFSPDGKSVLTSSIRSSGTGNARIWPRPFGRGSQPLEGDADLEKPPRFSQDGRWIFSTGVRGNAKLWEASTGRVVAYFPTKSTSYAWLSADARWLLTADKDSVLRRWDTVQLGSETRLLSLPTTTRQFALESSSQFPAYFSPDRKYLLALASDGTSRIWETATGQLKASLGNGDDGKTAPSLSPDGTRAIAAGADSVARVWDVASGKILYAFPKDTTSLVVVNFGDSKHPWTWDAKGLIRIVNLGEGKPDFTMKLGRPGCVTVSPDASWIVACGLSSADSVVDGSLQITDLRSQGVLTRTAHRNRIVDVFFSSDGKFAVSTSFDKTAVVWEVGSWRALATLKDFKSTVRYAFFSPDASLVGTISDDNSLGVFERNTGRLLSGIMQGHTKNVRTLAFSDDGRWMVSGSDDRTARVWDTRTGATVDVLQGQTGPVIAVAVSEHSRTITVASADGTIRSYRCDACISTGDLVERAKERLEKIAKSRPREPSQ